MRQIAQLAGVSTSTVSRVFNERPNVAPETVESVRRAMQTLRFTATPRRSSAKPRAARTATIAFLVFGTSGTRVAPAFEKLMAGVSAAASANDANLIFSFVSDPSQLPPKLAERQVDGLLLHGERPAAEVQQQLRSIPTVWLMANRQRPTWGDQVMPDNAAIGEVAAQYLLRRGHRELAFLSATLGSWGLEVRSLAFARAAADAGARAHLLEAADGRTAGDLWAGDGLRGSAQMMVEQLLQLRPQRPTGLFVAEDRLLPAVDAALTANGLTPGAGGDVELISCNNERQHLLGLSHVPATIDIRVESIGRRGVEQLLWRLRSGASDGFAERVRSMVEPVVVEPPPAPATAPASRSPA